jgi:arylsulfatase A-like enzyme
VCAIEAAPDVRLVFADTGRWFGVHDIPLRGAHGGLDTQRQLAAVTGGHPAATAVARALVSSVVRAEDWAPTIAALLGARLPTATGRDLLG